MEQPTPEAGPGEVSESTGQEEGENAQEINVALPVSETAVISQGEAFIHYTVVFARP